MAHVDNDRWRGVCTVYENAIYEYTVEAWTDTFRGWQHEFAAKFEAGITESPQRNAGRRGLAGRGRQPR